MVPSEAEAGRQLAMQPTTSLPSAHTSRPAAETFAAAPSKAAVHGSTYATPPAESSCSPASTSTDWRPSGSRTSTIQPYSDGGHVSWSATGRQQQTRPDTSGYQQQSGAYNSGHSGSYGSSYSYSYASGSGSRGGSYAYSYNESRGGRVSSSSYQYASNYQGTSGGRRGYGGGSYGRGYGRAPVGRGNGGGPPAAAQPPMWRKEGDILLPLPNSTLASAYAEARSARLAAAGPAPTAIIMRGLPGAGKSSRAAELAAEAAAQGSSCAVHCTDSFFVNAATGRYVFDPTMLSANHERNRAAFTASLAAGTLLVIVDNTNLQRWQYEPYVKAAWLAGYEVREEVVGEFTAAAVAVYASRCVHDIPQEKILMMMDQWQGQ